jgi:cyclase
MRRVGPNSFAEVYYAGCNPSFVQTSDGCVMIDTPMWPMDALRWRETIEERGPIRYLVNTEPHGDHTTGNAYFPHVPIIGHERILDSFDADLFTLWGTSEAKLERILLRDPDSAWLLDHPDYPQSNPPKLTFKDRMVIEVGNHTFHLLHHPGHTAPQTSVYVPQEGVVFTGDTVFNKCRSWLQDCDPWQWLEAIRKVEALDVEVIVPGHGEPCGKAYLREQAQIIENWLGLVGDGIDRGLSADDVLAQPIDARRFDPYPLGQRIFTPDAVITAMIVRNLHARILESRSVGPRAASFP